MFVKTNIKMAFSSHLTTIILKTVFKGPTMVGPIVDSGYKRSSTFSVNST